MVPFSDYCYLFSLCAFPFLYLSQPFMSCDILLAYFSILGICKNFFVECFTLFLRARELIYFMKCALSQSVLLPLLPQAFTYYPDSGF